MWLVLFFLVKSLFFLLCVGVRYFVSNLDKTFSILSTKASSFLSTITGCFESSTETTKAEAVVDEMAESELGKLKSEVVEARIDTSRESEVSRPRILSSKEKPVTVRYGQVVPVILVDQVSHHPLQSVHLTQ